MGGYCFSTTNGFAKTTLRGKHPFFKANFFGSGFKLTSLFLYFQVILSSFSHPCWFKGLSCLVERQKQNLLIICLVVYRFCLLHKRGKTKGPFHGFIIGFLRTIKYGVQIDYVSTYSTKLAVCSMFFLFLWISGLFFCISYDYGFTHNLSRKTELRSLGASARKIPLVLLPEWPLPVDIFTPPTPTLALVANSYPRMPTTSASFDFQPKNWDPVETANENTSPLKQLVRKWCQFVYMLLLRHRSLLCPPFPTSRKKEEEKRAKTRERLLYEIVNFPDSRFLPSLFLSVADILVVTLSAPHYHRNVPFMETVAQSSSATTDIFKEKLVGDNCHFSWDLVGFRSPIIIVAAVILLRTFYPLPECGRDTLFMQF